MLLYAHAMEAMLANGGNADDPDLLYQTMLSIPAFEGVAGPMILGSDGDRLGSYSLFNMQARLSS